MGFALSTLATLYRPLSRAAASKGQRPALHVVPDPTQVAPQRDAGAAARPTHNHGAQPAQGTSGMPTAARPVRVLLSREDGRACKLVISGRMADVCAELNRMALH